MLDGTSFNLVWNTNLFIQEKGQICLTEEQVVRPQKEQKGTWTHQQQVHGAVTSCPAALRLPFPLPEMYVSWGSQMSLALGTASMSYWLGSVGIFITLQFSTVTARSRTYYYEKRLSTVLRFDPFVLKCLIILHFIFPAKESFDLKMKRKWGWLEAKWFWRVIVYLCYTWYRISINFWQLSDIVSN